MTAATVKQLRDLMVAAAFGLAAFGSTQASAQAQEIGLRCAPFGSIMYTVGNAIQDLTQKRHPTLRITNAEGPGSTAMTVNMMEGGVWAKSIGCTSVLDYVYAEQGIKPFFDEAHPTVRDDVKILFNGFYGAIGILTTNGFRRHDALARGASRRPRRRHHLADRHVARSIKSLQTRSR